MTLVHEPGTIRYIRYGAQRDADGRYPVVYWGSVEEQVAETTARNLEHSSSHLHEDKTLYRFASDCGHKNPDNDPKFAGIEDLVDEWMNRNCAGLSRDEGELYWRNRSRAELSIPLYAEWLRADLEYSDTHIIVCLESPIGTYCTECTDGNDDFGYEPEGCRRQEFARERWDQFWDSVSPEAFEHRANERSKEIS